MSYSVEHIRYTLECDVCGLTEKRDTDAGDVRTAAGWSNVATSVRSYFCCPGCLLNINAVLEARPLAALKARQEEVANCEHDYQPKGFLSQCAKCKVFRQ